MRKFICVIALSMSIRGFADSIPGLTTQPIDFPASAGAMTVGPDGNIWIVVVRQNALGRLTASGGYTSFPIPSRNAEPVSIATGADGNLWFVEGIGQVGRMTPAGAFTEFLIPPSLTGGAWAIASGPDGTAWFLEAVDGKHVARVDANGTFTDFAVPNAQFLGGIAPAADGLWLIDTSANMIMKMQMDGSISATHSIPAGPSFSSATGITALDGTFWFIHGTNGVARITTDGVVTEYPVPVPNALPSGVALGNDGNIWFSDYSNNQIGQLVVSTATSDGHATINQSAPFGEKLADILFLGAQKGASSSAGSRIVPLDDSPPCADAQARVRKDNGSSGNIVSVKVIAPAHCADMAVLNAAYSLGRFGNPYSFVTSDVMNLGKDDTTGVSVRMTFYPNLPIDPQLNCPSGPGNCKANGSFADCSITTLKAQTSCHLTVQIRPVPGLDNIVIASMAASSALYDQDLTNNTSTLRIDTTNKQVTNLPPDSNTPVVTNPVGRGH